MAPITGRQGKIGIDVKAAASRGTATAVTTAIGIEPGSFSQSLGSEELTNSPVGRAEPAHSRKDRGRTNPTLSFTSKIGYNNGLGELLAVFMGASAAPTEQTTDQDDYLHRITLNPVRNAFYLTMASQWTTTQIAEWTDVWINDVTITWQDFPNHVPAAFNCGASNRVTKAGLQVNSYAGLTSLAPPVPNEIVHRETHRLRINADTGDALDNDDTVPFTNAVLSLADPQETISESKGAPGVANRNTDFMVGTLAVTFKDLADFKYFDAADDGETFKCDLVTTGSQIGTGELETFGLYVPYMKVVKDPEYNQASAGFNPHTVIFDLLYRGANPTGMESRYAYFEFINGLATSFLA